MDPPPLGGYAALGSGRPLPGELKVMDQAGHDAHFLRRVDRLSTEHAELALGLYRDHALVKGLLKRAKLPDACDRVALSLHDDKEGPFIIVTREGKFVTCLGVGMHVPEGQPVVSRSTLDQLSHQVQALRELMEKAKDGQQHQCRWLVGRVLRAGPALLQEQFDDLVVWTPLLHRVYYDALIRTMDVSCRTYDTLRSVKRLGARRHEKLIRKYWEATWATAHVTALVGAQPRTLRLLLDACDDQFGVDPQRRTGLIRVGVETNAMPFAMRAAWFAAKVPKVFLSCMKQQYAEAQDFETMLACGLGLVATGLRHTRYQAEVGKTLERSKSRLQHSDTPASVMSEMFVQYYGRVRNAEGNNAEDKLASTHAEMLLDSDGMKAFCSPKQKRFLAELPVQAKLAALLQLPLPVWKKHSGPVQLLQWLPEIAQLKPRDFYLPEAHSGIFSTSFQLKTGLAFLQPRLEVDPKKRPRPKVASRRPGRNDPCPCGSGKKYKRCCGAN